MATNSPISFRLTDRELELLGNEQRDGESLSLTAARLLRERLGVVNNLSTEEKTTINEIIDWKIQSVILTMNEAMKINLSTLSQRIDNIEEKLNKPRARRTSQKAKDSL